MLLNQGIGPTTKGEPYIDGAQFAQEAYYWKSQGKQITVKINCLGGRVLHGWDIVDAILECEADTFGAGVAYSMAGMCLIAGKNRRAYNHASAMIHAPHNPANREKSTITEVMKAQFTSLLQSRTKFTADEIATLMNGEDHFFSADKMLEKGMIDKVISSGIVAPVNASAEELLAFYNNSIEDFKQPNNSDMDFKTILAKLTGKESEAEGIVAVTEMKSQIEQLKAKNTELETEKKNLETKVKQLEDASKNSEAKTKAVELIEGAVKANKLSFKDDAEKVKAIDGAIANYDFTKQMIDAMPTKKVAAAAAIPAADGKQVETYEWLAKNDPKKLAAIAETDPELFNKLSDEYLASQNQTEAK